MDQSVLIFLVEDEHSIRDMLVDVLEEGGFEVATANNGEDAVALLDAAEADYRALITDVNLTPGPLAAGT